MGLGKTIQVISFLSAIMRKHGDERDLDRRHDYVSELQDGKSYRKKGILPKANATWPTCLIIAVSCTSAVLANYYYILSCVCGSLLLSSVIGNESSRLGDTSRSGYIMVQRTSEKKYSRILKWDVLTLVSVLTCAAKN